MQHSFHAAVTSLPKVPPFRDGERELPAYVSLGIPLNRARALIERTGRTSELFMAFFINMGGIRRCYSNPSADSKKRLKKGARSNLAGARRRFLVCVRVNDLLILFPASILLSLIPRGKYAFCFFGGSRISPTPCTRPR